MNLAVKDFLPRAKSLDRVVFCLYDRSALAVFEAAHREIFA